MSTKELSNSFCALAWKQLHVTPTGVIKPCCIFDGGLKSAEGKVLRIGDADIQDIWNSTELTSLRLQMLNGDMIPDCKKCYEEERVSGTSDRVRAMDHSPSFLAVVEDSSSTGQVKELPPLLNLKFGNLCNLKCRMCQPLDSSAVDAEFSAIAQTSPNFRSFDNTNAFDYNYSEVPVQLAGRWTEDKRARDNLLCLIEKCTQISLAGGETTFSDDALFLLQKSIDNGRAKQIKVIMSSNLTRITDQLLEIMSQFKKFDVAASIDGVGPVNDYIRYPSKWQTVKANLEKLCAAPANILPVLAPTVQIYNILDVPNILQICEDIASPKWKTSTPVHLTILFDPQHLSIRHLPKNVKMEALRRLEEFEKKSRYLRSNSYYASQFNLLKRTLSEDILPSTDGPSSSDYMAYFAQYTNDLDSHRHQRLEDFIPELHAALASENISPRYPKTDPRNFTYYRYRDTGFRFQTEGKLELALSMFESAYAMFKDDPDLNFSLGIALKDCNQRERATELFLRVVNTNPAHTDGYIELGLYYQTQNQAKKAAEFLHLARTSCSDPKKQEMITAMIAAQGS
jgi:MoaA/NifB/PqqE/SkfB family radical SAM enzyme